MQVWQLALSLKIFSHRTSLKLSQRPSNQHENSPKLYDETTSRFEFEGKSMKTSEKINKSKRAGLWESQSGIPEGKLTIWVRLFEIEKLWQFTKSISSTKNRLTSPYDGRCSLERQTPQQMGGSREHHLCWWNRIKNCIKTKTVIDGGKKIRHWVT